MGPTAPLSLATRRLQHALPIAACASVAALAALLGWRGSDFPAQGFRADLFSRYGFTLWNNQWYGGHATLDYGVIAPALGAWLGPVLTAILASLAASFAFARLLRRYFPATATVGAVWFALGTVTNVIVGRVPFSLGIAFAIVTLLMLESDRLVLAFFAALLTSMASPVAAVFLGIAVVARAIESREHRRQAAVSISATLLPLAVTAVFFGTTGRFPFTWGALVFNLLTCAAVWYLVGSERRTIRVGVGLYAAAMLATFVVNNPIGGNMTRLGQFFAGPLLACLLWNTRRKLLLVLAVPLLLWQWTPAYDGMARAPSDPSTKPEYYEPLNAYLNTQLTPLGRLEIPFTHRHWEAQYVAQDFPLARGWERQLDIADNAIFYDAGTLNANSYRLWLITNGIELVALPDAALDQSAEQEAALIRSGLPYLTPVWSNAHWKVWKVDDFKGLVQGPATLVSMEPASFTLQVTGPGPVTVRVRASSHWVVGEQGCAAADSGGWTRLEDLPLGTVKVTQGWAGTSCS